ncbi:50S ribosomal protein L29 [Nitrospira sp. T9]|jgi:large subunit ribosomal protein L29|uniref:Large ribosomal subunit protein uL29 n=2 Tax=Nitrospira TaxID=1234 RepID=A0AA96JTV0_9BACT|nr:MULTISPECIES: 50S ribosomal protein L29 [Nitrospira]WNM59505.1 50S ribosomal protein L29 [Candidatus Nitrospira allomarina]WNM61658.1 50S ribosomal protein L29 [Candidatus Nitrospira neomarina]
MEMDEIKNLEKSELFEKINKLKQELFHFRSQLALGRMENPMRIRETRKDIARVKTVLRQKAN